MEPMDVTIDDFEFNENSIFEIGNWIDSKCLENNENNPILQKDKNLSTETRKSGNDMYVDKHHSEIAHRKMLQLYSKSIALAPNDSEELGLGYSNRSALLYHLGKYEECVIDVERALEILQSEKVKMKLATRELDCSLCITHKKEQLESMSVKNKLLNYNIKFELPKIESSQEIPSLANCVSVVYDKTHGRQMIATKDIKPGEIIAIEEGYVTFPLKHQVFLVCHHCLDFSWNAIPCDSCACVMYCSKKCKIKAWKEYHDIECLVLPYLRNKYVELLELTQSKAATRLFITAVKKEGLEKIMNDAKNIDSNRDQSVEGFFENGIFSSAAFRSLYNLDCYNEKIPQIKDKIDSICPIIFELFVKYTNMFKDIENGKDSEKVAEFKAAVVNVLQKLISIIVVNAAKFTGSCKCKNPDMCYSTCEMNRGLILTPVCSLFKHSCTPNVGRIFSSKKKIVLFTLKPIKQGEQLRISYGPLLSEDVKETRIELLKKYFFTSCDCEACKEDWKNDTPDSPDDLASIKEANEFKTSTSKKLLKEENLSPIIMDNFGSNVYDEETLKYSYKMLELIYEKYSSYISFLLCKPYTNYIQSVFQTIYGIDYKIPKETLHC